MAERSASTLLLDDEKNILTAPTRLLRCDGYKIFKATSAAATFDLLAAHPVGVIVSVQRMPEMMASSSCAASNASIPTLCAAKRRTQWRKTTAMCDILGAGKERMWSV